MPCKYLPRLAAAGIDVTWAPLLDDAYLEALYGAGRRPWPQVARAYLARLGRLLGARDFDLLWIEKELFPMLPATVERLLAATGAPYVVDYDDALFHNYDLHRSALVRRLLGHKIDRVMAGARLVIAGNDYLAARAVQAGARWIEQLPTVIDLDRYPAVPDAAPDPARPFTIGWIGSPQTAEYLAAVAEPCAGCWRVAMRAWCSSVPAAERRRTFPPRSVPGRKRARWRTSAHSTSASCRCRMRHGSGANAATS